MGHEKSFLLSHHTTPEELTRCSDRQYRRCPPRQQPQPDPLQYSTNATRLVAVNIGVTNQRKWDSSH
jgi:hypothetical protein